MKFDLIIEDTTHTDVLQSFFVVVYWDFAWIPQWKYVIFPGVGLG
jgi:hypothetical protein